MSQGDTLNNLINGVLGWNRFDTEILYLKKGMGTKPLISGWWLRSDILPYDHFLGENFEKALGQLCARSFHYEKISGLMGNLKNTDIVGFEDMTKVLDLDHDVDDFFPEFAKEDENIHASALNNFKYFALGMVSSGAAIAYSFWTQIVISLLGG